MRKILMIFMAAFLSLPSMARVCMLNNLTTIATKAELATKASQTELAVQIAILSTRIAALESQPTDLSWLSTWSNASGMLPGSSYTGDNSSPTWSVTAYYADSGTKTVSGSSLCSNISGSKGSRGNPSETGTRLFCWCKMTAPRAGVWIFADEPCYNNNNDCSYKCARDVQGDSTIRTAVLALP